MSVSIGIHLGAEVRVTAPERTDAYLDIVHEGTAISLFLGHDDHERITVIDRLAEALLEARVRCMQRLVTIDPEVQVYGGDDRAREAAEMTESEQRALHGDR